MIKRFLEVLFLVFEDPDVVLKGLNLWVVEPPLRVLNDAQFILEFGDPCLAAFKLPVEVGVLTIQLYA